MCFGCQGREAEREKHKAEFARLLEQEAYLKTQTEPLVERNTVIRRQLEALEVKKRALQVCNSENLNLAYLMFVLGLVWCSRRLK